MVRNESNLGIHGALRRGMQILHAEGFAYVARLDAGDFALPMRFRLQKEFLDRHPDTAVVGSAFERADDDGRLLCTMHAPTTDPAIRRLKILSLCLEHPTVMMRVDAVAAVGNYGDAYPCAEDMDLFLRLMRQYKVANLPEVLTRIVVYENGITVRRRRRMIISTIRLQARDFRAACWADWAGIAKCVSQLLLPRSLFEHLKLIYLRGDPYRGKPSSAGGA
ncbi:MAG TPA: glycosyltransferase [Rhodospirillales bacterium]|nr:glycosyltransferase [Rhodospirillales bacterium]